MNTWTAELAATAPEVEPEAGPPPDAEAVAREKHAPPEGSEAPDFEIERLSPEGKRTGEMFRLSAMRGRPVALIFGSYT